MTNFKGIALITDVNVDMNSVVSVDVDVSVDVSNPFDPFL